MQGSRLVVVALILLVRATSAWADATAFSISGTPIGGSDPSEPTIYATGTITVSCPATLPQDPEYTTSFKFWDGDAEESPPGYYSSNVLVAPVNSDDWIVHCDAPKTIALRVSYRYEVVTPTTFTVSACEAMGQVGYPCDGPAVHTTVTVVPPGYTLTLAPTSVTAGDSVTATLTRSVRQGFNGGWYVFDIDPNHCTMATQPCPYQATMSYGQSTVTTQIVAVDVAAQSNVPVTASYSFNGVVATAELVVTPLPTVSGPTEFWWFGGATVSGWTTSALLTSSAGSSTTWAIASGSDKVTLSSTSGAQTTVRAKGTAFSGTVGDIVIRATSASGVATLAMTLKRPFTLAKLLNYSNGTTNILYGCGSGPWGSTNYVYKTFLAYEIRDQFGTMLPAAVPLNEQWTTNFTKDYKKTTWSTNIIAQGFTTGASASFADGIEGDTPTATPTPTCDPNSVDKVMHWGQTWRVGSTTVGTGQRVQTDVIQKDVGRAEHLNIVTPAP